MIRIKRIGQWSLLLLIGWVSTLPAAALSKPSYRSNDINFLSDSVFQVTGRDPYLIFTPLNPIENPRYLILDLRKSKDTVTTEQVSMELFFRSPPDQSNNFDPLYRVQFQVNSSELTGAQTRLAVPLPSSGGEMPVAKMRLDINQCLGCTFDLGAYPRFANETGAGAGEITPTRVFNGLARLQDFPQNLADLDWRLHDLEQSEDGLTLTGDDPYLVSPELDLAAAELGGVRFLVTVSNTDADFVDFQFFYATESHRFTERASTYLRITPEPDGRIEFMIPLRYLATNAPVRQSVQSFRLDLPGTLAEAVWQLNDVSLVPAEKLTEFENLVPTKMIQAKQQRAHGLQLLRNSLSKVFADRVFSISYFLLMLLTVIGFWRAYKQ